MDGEQDLQVRIAKAVGLEESEPDTSGEVSKIVTPEDPAYEPLQKFYGMEEVDPKQQEQLKTVWEYYSKGREGDGEILKAIREAQSFLVAPEIGQTRLSQLSDYVKIVKDVESAQAMKEAYQKEPK